MRSPDCAEVEKLIIQDLDEGLDPERRIELDAHLRACPDCARFMQEMGSIFSAIASDSPEDPGERYWTNYRVSLEARLAEEEPPSRWGLTLKAAAAVALVAAGLACLMIGLGTVDRDHKPLTDPTVRLEVIEDLNVVYGPTDPETGPSYAISGKTVDALSEEAAGYEERYLSWFEVEDESNHLLL